MSKEFEISDVEAPDNVGIFRVQGQMDAKNTPVLLQHCREVKGAGKHLVLNLSEVTFVASSGIGGLLVLAEEFREADLSVRFTALSPAAESVISLLNLGSFLGIDATEDESLAALAA